MSERERERELEERLGIPAGFGGLAAFWLPSDEHRALLVRCGHGRILEAMALTPLNAIQLEKLAASLVARGRAEGHITADHQAQADKLPTMPVQEFNAEYSDRITGGE